LLPPTPLMSHRLISRPILTILQRENLPNDDVYPFSRDKVEIVVRPTHGNGGHGVMRDRATGKETRFWQHLAYEEYLEQRRKLRPQAEAAWRVRLADLRVSLAQPVADANASLISSALPKAPSIPNAMLWRGTIASYFVRCAICSES
jgi:hypothetical protein